MIKRSHVRQFLAVVDAGSFTHAAARIRLTQPTLSAGIAELERLVGTRLFVRDRRQLRLTEAGGRLLTIARGLERDFRQLDAFGRAAAPEGQALKLGMIPTLAPAMFEAIVAALAGRFPLELIDGRDADLRSALADGRIHAALTLQRSGDTGPHCMPLFAEAYAMLAPAGHRLAGSELAEPEDLASEIMIARRACEMLNETSRFFTAKGVRPRFAYRSHDDARCLALVAAGEGLTAAPLSMVRPGVVPIRVRGYDFSRRLVLIGDPHVHAMPGMRERFDQAVHGLEAALTRFGSQHTPESAEAGQIV